MATRRLRPLLWLLLVAAVVAVASWGLYAVSRPAPGSAPAGDQFDVGVLFVTNRGHDPTARPAARFDGSRGELRFGRCDVRFSPIPMANDLAARAPFFVPTDIRDVVDVTLLTPDDFGAAIGRADAGPEALPIVLYVHGYSYGFARTCRMGAELQRMLDDRARVVMFSWPSDANPADYVADQVDVEWSVPDLAGVIASLRQRFGTAQVRVLAHSLGSRGTLFALQRMAATGEDLPLIDHLVLLAPDFDAGTFSRNIEDIRPLADKMTLYASENDAPLVVSATLHGHPRLGQAGETLLVLPGMTTIDVTDLGRYHPSGHEYFYYHPVVAADLSALLTTAPAPADRPNTAERRQGDQVYWILEK
ncbi:MAG: alpha/beta hydrolase [Pseudomonadota bacterium]